MTIFIIRSHDSAYTLQQNIKNQRSPVDNAKPRDISNLCLPVISHSTAMNNAIIPVISALRNVHLKDEYINS